MKSILIIGMGCFGHHLAKNFLENGHDVMIIDENEEAIEDMVPYATSSKIGDCTREEVLKTIGVRNFDAVFVCIVQIKRALCNPCVKGNFQYGSFFHTFCGK